MANNFSERFILNSETRENIIYNEHLIRYELAKKIVSGKTVLDIACGTGFGAKILASKAKKVVAVDASKEALDCAEKENLKENILYKEGNAENLEEDDNFFDLIVSFETIEHLKNQDKYLAELKRVLKKGGVALISTPNRLVFKEKNPYHFKEFTKKEFEEILKKYFDFFHILEQSNGVSSTIRVNNEKECNLIGGEFGEPQYFIAICSDKKIDIEDILKVNITSINQKALNNLYNNPGLKLVDSAYRLITLIPGIKSIFKR